MGIYNFGTQGSMCLYSVHGWCKQFSPFPIMGICSEIFSSSNICECIVIVHAYVFLFICSLVRSFGGRYMYCSFLFHFRCFFFHRWKINSANEDIYGMFRFWYSEANLVQYTYNFAKMFDAIQIFNKVSAQITTHIR